MGAHGRQPFFRCKDLPVAALFGGMDDGSLLRRIPHPLLGEGCPDDVAAQALRRRFIIRHDALSAEHMKAGVAPSGKQAEQLFRDLRGFRMSLLTQNSCQKVDDAGGAGEHGIHGNGGMKVIDNLFFC